MAYDAHLHVDLYPAPEREALLDAAFAGGVSGVVAVSMDLASSEVNRTLAAQYAGRVMPAYGQHPEQAPLTAEALDRLCLWIRELAAAGERFAIGEVGLPYYLRTEKLGAGEAFDEEPYVRQLERFVQLAAELDRPIVLHAVYEDADKALDLLERYGVRRAHFHWFKAGEETIARLVRGGYAISITPDVGYEPEIQALAAAVPLEQLMVETDGPWPFEGAFAGRGTVPAMTLDVIREIARLRGLDASELERQLDENTRHFYGFARD